MWSNMGLLPYCEPNYYVRIYQHFTDTWDYSIGHNESYKHISNGNYNNPFFMRSSENYNLKNPPTKDATIQQKLNYAKGLASLNK